MCTLYALNITARRNCCIILISNKNVIFILYTCHSFYRKNDIVLIWYFKINKLSIAIVVNSRFYFQNKLQIPHIYWYNPFGMIFTIWNALKQQISSPKLFIILNIYYIYLPYFILLFKSLPKKVCLLQEIFIHVEKNNNVFSKHIDCTFYTHIWTDTCLTHFECYIRFWERGRDRTQHDGHCPRPHPRVCSRRCPYTRHGARRTLFRDLQSDWTILAYNYSQSF